MSSPQGARGTVAQPAGSRLERARRADQRRAARRRRRRARVLLGFAAVLTGAALTAGPALVGHILAPDSSDSSADAAEEQADGLAAAPADEPQRRLLLVTAEEPSGPATSITLLAGPSGDGPASALFLPTSTLVSTPGFGLDQLSSAHRYGGPELVRAAVENALSAHIDAVAAVTAPGLAEFLGRAGPLDVDVPERVVERRPDGSATVRFERGEQTMGGAELADLWLHGSAGDELSAFNRRRLVLEGMLRATADPVVRDRLVADGAPQLRTDAETEWLRALFADLAAAQADDRMRYNLLPVERFGSAGAGGARAYRIHEEDTARLVRALLGGEQDVAESSAVRAQVLNGVGTPGVGQAIDRMLGGDVRLVLTGNANSFDHAQTRLVVYEETTEALEAARRVQERLGVGTIQVSRHPQSIVDLTIVVGADLMGAVSEDQTDGSEPPD